MGDGGVPGQVRERTDDDRASAVIMVVVYCGSAVVAGIAMAVVVLELFETLRSWR